MYAWKKESNWFDKNGINYKQLEVIEFPTMPGGGAVYEIMAVDRNGEGGILKLLEYDWLKSLSCQSAILKGIV